MPYDHYDDQLTEADYPPTIGSYVSHPDHPGVAFRIKGFETHPVTWTSYETNDNGELVEVGEHEAEYLVESTVYCVAVGDDYVWTFHGDDLEPLSTEDFCDGCGQIGCEWDAREREESAR